jgi:hypothetical protein
MPLNHYQVLTILREEQTSGINKEVLTSFNKRHMSGNKKVAFLPLFVLL